MPIQKQRVRWRDATNPSFLKEGIQMKRYLKFLTELIESEDFRQKNFRRKALHLNGSTDGFPGLFSWSQLNTVLNSSPYPHPKMKMSYHGRQFQPKTADDLIQSTRKGATLIVENIDRYDRALGHFLSSFSEFLDEEARLNMYLSYPSTGGYGIHYDTHDFFILQVEGHKRWFIYPETTQSVLFNQKYHDREPPPESTKYMECVLGPGDVLYVPRGHWHYALAEGDPSVHLTLAMFFRTGIDLLKWAVDELTENESFRKTLPTTFESGFEEHLEQLKAGIVEFFDREDFLDRFLEYKRAVHRDRAPFAFPDHTEISRVMLENAQAFSRRPQAANILTDEVSGKVRVACSGRLTTFPKEAETLLRFIYSRFFFTKQELFSADPLLSTETVLSVLHQLVGEGYCSIAE